jgi:hypothetical protein
VLAVSFETRWQGEVSQTWVWDSDSADGIATHLEGGDVPTPGAFGYPIGAQFERRQAWLVSDLQARWALAVTEILGHLGAERRIP